MKIHLFTLNDTQPTYNTETAILFARNNKP